MDRFRAKGIIKQQLVEKYVEEFGRYPDIDTVDEEAERVMNEARKKVSLLDKIGETNEKMS